MNTEKLAILGGKPVVQNPPESLFKWPIVTEEDEQAVLEVMRSGDFSGYSITQKFEQEFAAWMGVKHALGFCNGTQSLAAAMFAIGLGAGDEIICPTTTYWASISPSLIFGAKPVFCNVDENLSLDPEDFERKITSKTKAVVAVHYCAYPCDMDRIMEIANRHNIIVIEDVSHAQGGYYKGKKLGTFGQVAAMSMMSMKSFAIGEAGMLVTNDTRIYERALAYGHYDRNTPVYIKESVEELKDYFYLPLGGVKARVNQTCSAMGRVQLKYYDQRIAEIDKAMNYFWDLLEGVPGIRPIRTEEGSGSTMAGWYAAKGKYVPEELHGLPLALFAKAVSAEGYPCHVGANFCLHTHKLFSKFDFRNAGKPASIEYTEDKVYDGGQGCERSLEQNCFAIPWFKHFDKEWIERYAAAFRKVAENHMQLMDLEEGQDVATGRWYGL